MENRGIGLELSVQAITWAFAQPIRPASRKFVLVTLANFSGNEDGICFPCVQTLCDYTCLDRKTVLDCLTDLCSEGWIEDTGERKGITKQVKVFKLKVSQKRNGSENGTVPVLPEKGPVFPSEGSPKRDTEPSGNRQGTLRESDRGLAQPALTGRRPRTVDEAIARASMIGMQEQDARDWYRDCEACGWLRGDGTPFDNWVRQMCIHRDKIAERRARAPQQPMQKDAAKAKSVYELAKIIELKEERCKNLKHKAYNEGPLGGTWSNDKARQEYIQIRQDIKSLKEQIEQRA